MFRNSQSFLRYLKKKFWGANLVTPKRGCLAKKWKLNVGECKILSNFCSIRLFKIFLVFNFLSIIHENFKCLSLPILENQSGQIDLSKNIKIGYFLTGSDVSKIWFDNFLPCPIPSYHENSMKIHPRIWGKTSKKKKKNREKET